jgi:pyridoxamine 5'-phosphate oxidase
MHIEDSLSRQDADPDPFIQFARWYAVAEASGLPMPQAMALATATPDGRPAVRMVLMRAYGATEGLVFFTNYESRKGRELAENPQAALLFHWPLLNRQVRIEGMVAPLSPAASDAYFITRPRGSQLSTWASPQSRAVENREALEQAWATAEARFAGREVERPPYWGGYRLEPQSFEFWQGRENRFHDRLRYERQADGSWQIERLAP